MELQQCANFGRWNECAFSPADSCDPIGDADADADSDVHVDGHSSDDSDSGSEEDDEDGGDGAVDDGLGARGARAARSVAATAAAASAAVPPAPRLVCVEENPGPPRRAEAGAHPVRRILDWRPAGPSAASRWMMRAGVLSEIDFLVEWEGHTEPTWNPALNHVVGGVLEPVAAAFLRTMEEASGDDAAGAGAGAGAGVGIGTASPGRLRDRDRNRTRRRHHHRHASRPASADPEDYLPLDQLAADHMPLDQLAADHLPLDRVAAMELRRARLPASAPAAAASDSTDSEDHWDLDRLSGHYWPRPSPGAQAHDVEPLQASSTESGAGATPAAAPGLLVAVPSAAAESGRPPLLSWSLAPGWPAAASPTSPALASVVPANSLRGPSSDVVVDPVAGAFAVTRVLPFGDRAAAGARAPWSVLDVLHFPDEAALRQAMVEHYAGSRMPYWTTLLNFRLPAPDEALLAAQCAGPLASSQLSATAAMPLFAGWLMRAVRAAAQLPCGASIRDGIDEPAWSRVLDDLFNDADDKKEETQRWSQEPVWLCVHQSTPCDSAALPRQ